MTSPPNGKVPEETQGQTFGEGCPKRPWHSKKWTYSMWVTSMLCGILVFYLDLLAGEHKDMVVYVFLGLITSIAMLTIGGVYALDKYRMGLVQVVQAVRGELPDNEDNLHESSGRLREPTDDPNTD